MKMQLLAIVLIAGLSMATAAVADCGRGGQGSGSGMCPQMQQLDAETMAKVSQFYKDNRDLRKQMVMKMAEKKALMRNTNPDAKAVAIIAGELFDLRAALHDKAEAAGVAKYLGSMKGHGKMGGCPYGGGHGMHGGGHGGRHGGMHGGMHGGGHGGGHDMHRE